MVLVKNRSSTDKVWSSATLWEEAEVIQKPFWMSTAWAGHYKSELKGLPERARIKDRSISGTKIMCGGGLCMWSGRPITNVVSATNGICFHYIHQSQHYKREYHARGKTDINNLFSHQLGFAHIYIHQSQNHEFWAKIYNAPVSPIYIKV